MEGVFPCTCILETLRYHNTDTNKNVLDKERCTSTMSQTDVSLLQNKLQQAQLVSKIQ